MLTRGGSGGGGGGGGGGSGGHFRIRAILHGLEVVPSLRSLDLSGLGLDAVTNETFDFIATTELAELRLSRNELTRFDDQLVGRDLKRLVKIDLSHNYVETVRGLDEMQGLEEVRRVSVDKCI